MSRKMKDSGIKWIGFIPSDWKIVSVKKLFEIGRGRVIAKTELLDNGYPVYSSQTKNNGVLGFIGTYDFERSQLTWTTDGANAGTVFLRKGKHNCTNVCGTLMPKTQNNNLEYLYYILAYTAFFHKRADINGYKIMNNEMAEIEILLPPLSEQTAISTYLDTKCAHIDNIIEKTKASIEEYKKLKQAVITQAVTKGIRSNREMKDSGIDWIGEIPEGYSVCRLKFLLEEPLMYGANESGVSYDDNKIRYIRITDITPDGHIKDTGKLSLEKDIAEPYILKDLDVLFARSGATVGKAFIYKKEYGIAAFAGYLIRARVNNKICSKYLYYYTMSSLYVEWKNQTFIQSTIQNIGADRYNQLSVVLPNSTIEQQEIIAYLDQKCTEIDAIITKKQQFITEMENYKKSLIFECVTGKREVYV